MSFTSQIATRDPYPWRVVLGPWRNTRVATPVPDSEWDPRPEYDPRANPILVEFRSNGGKSVYWRDLDRMPTEEEKDHARKVLTRLAALRGEVTA